MFQVIYHNKARKKRKKEKYWPATAWGAKKHWLFTTKV